MRESPCEGLFLRLALCLFFSAVTFVSPRPSQSQVVRFGDLFPPYGFQGSLSEGDRLYLGVSEGETFTIRDIDAELIVLEILNTYCTSCQKQAPLLNQVFHAAQADPVTQGRIKWLGVAVGNNDREVAAFREEKEVPFPILDDVDFTLYDTLGGPGGIRTPLTVLIRKNEKERGIVVESHVGFWGDAEAMFQGMKAALLHDLAYLKVTEGKRAILPEATQLTPPISQKALLGKIREGMAATATSVEEIRKIPLRDTVVYLGSVRIASQAQQLFAKVVSRPPVCDICHDIHFIYIFDEGGEIVNFIPIQLPKYGNRLWNVQDVLKTKNRLIGRSALETFRFDREVDAVSGATITSIVVFDSMNRAKSIYADLMRADYVE